MLKIFINNITSLIEGQLEPLILNQLSTECSFIIQGSEFSPKFAQGFWDGSKKLFNIRKQTFPTGLLSRIRKILNINGLKYEIIDSRIAPTISQIPLYPPGPIRPYQEDTIKTAIERTRGMIKSATGSGKTLNNAGIVANTNLNTLVVTHTSSVFEQTIKDFENYLKIPIGRIGAGEKKIEKVTVALIQSLVESIDIAKPQYVATLIKKTKSKKKIIARTELVEYFAGIECLLIDEGHHISTDSAQALAGACTNAYYRLACSASPWRDSHDDILLECVTGKQIINYSASYLIKLGYLSKPTIHLIPFAHHRQPRSLKYKDLYTQEIVENKDRNDLVCKIARKHIDKGESVLIAVQRIRHGELLEADLKSTYGDKVRFVNGEDNSEEQFQALQDLEKKTLLCAIATAVYKEGVNIPSLNVLISCAAGDSTVAAFQLVGRALRKTATKNTVDVYDLVDSGCRFFSSHADSRIEIYQTEPEYTLVEGE